MIGKNYCILGRIREERGIGEVRFVPEFGSLEGGATPGKFCSFYLHLN